VSRFRGRGHAVACVRDALIAHHPIQHTPSQPATLASVLRQTGSRINRSTHGFAPQVLLAEQLGVVPLNGELRHGSGARHSRSQHTGTAFVSGKRA
jgi:hypothetical protein